MTVAPRPAAAGDVAEVAAIWEHGWRDGHLGHVPGEPVAGRTPASFLERAAERLSATTVASVDGEAGGFVVVAGDEVEQVYAAAAHRGSGVAAAPLTEATRQVAAAEYATAWQANPCGGAS